MTKPNLRTEIVSEWCQEGSFETEGVIKNVLLCGNKSRNGYDIPAKAFRDESHVRGLYDGKMIFFNHDMDKPSHRDLSRDFAGVVRNVRLVDGRPRADIDTRGTPAGNSLWSIAQINPPPKGLGLSHVAAYRFSDGMSAVEEVEQVVTVDLVMTPATTNSLYEHTGERPLSMEVFETELKLARSERDAANVKAEQAETQVADLKAQLEAMTAERDSAVTANTELETKNSELEDQLDKINAEKAMTERKALVAEELVSAGLDPKDTDVVSERFLKRLYTITDADERAEEIADRVAAFGANITESIGAKHRQQKAEWSPDSILSTL